MGMSFGYGPAADKQGGLNSKPESDGIRLGGTGDVTATHRAWRQPTIASVPSPAVYEVIAEFNKAQHLLSRVTGRL
jgi:hypothetical protein